jgi:hypothetical protein
MYASVKQKRSLHPSMELRSLLRLLFAYFSSLLTCTLEAGLKWWLVLCSVTSSSARGPQWRQWNLMVNSFSKSFYWESYITLLPVKLNNFISRNYVDSIVSGVINHAVQLLRKWEFFRLNIQFQNALAARDDREGSVTINAEVGIPNARQTCAKQS